MNKLSFTPLNQLLSAERSQKILFRGNSGAISAGWMRVAVARLVCKLCLMSGKRVLITAEDSACFTLALLAAAYAGKTVVLLPEDSEDYIAEHLEYFDLVLGVRQYESLPCPQLSISCAQGQHVTEEERQAEATFDECALDYGSEIFLFTSGSTGAPKLVKKTLAIMEHESRLLFDKLKDLAEDCEVVSTVYPQHLYGLTFRIFMPLCFGLIAQRHLVHFTEELCALPHDRYLLVTSPIFLKHIDTDLPAPNLALVISSAGALPYEVAAAVEKWSEAKIFEIYGSTECGVMGWRLRSDPRSYFKAFPEVSFTMGQQYYLLHSPLVPEEETQLLDVLEFFQDGSFKPSGRFDSIIKIDERRISLPSVRAELLELPEIEDAEVVTYQAGERTFIGAVAVLRPQFRHPEETDGILRLQQRLRQHIAARLGSKAQPRRFIFVDAIPENALGKRSLRKLQELFRLQVQR